jgi:hypothetical protein
MNQIYWMMMIALIQTQCMYGMDRERERTPDAVAVEMAKKMKFTNQDELRSQQASDRSSAMKISDTAPDENDSALGICFTDADMQEIAERLEEVRLAQMEAEEKMTPKEHDEYYRLALIRAIGNSSVSSRDGNDHHLAQDRDW